VVSCSFERHGMLPPASPLHPCNAPFAHGPLSIEGQSSCLPVTGITMLKVLCQGGALSSPLFCFPSPPSLPSHTLHSSKTYVPKNRELLKSLELANCPVVIHCLRSYVNTVFCRPLPPPAPLRMPPSPSPPPPSPPPPAPSSHPTEQQDLCPKEQGGDEAT
jgi:hypothetical protein